MALRELLVEFETKVNTAPLKAAGQQVDQLKGHMGGVINSLQTLGPLISAVFAGIALHSIKEFITAQIDLGSEIHDTAAALGVGTKELQQFQFAAKLAGVDTAEANTAIRFLNKNLAGTDEAGNKTAATFAKLGVQTKDAAGKTRPVLDVMTDLADHFKDSDDSAGDTALAMQLFGRAGAKLIPTLKAGGEEMRKTFKEAEDLGGILDDEFLNAADDAGDEIDKFKFATQGLKIQLAKELLPWVSKGILKLKEWAVDTKKLFQNTNILKTGILALSTVLGVKLLGSLLSLSSQFGFGGVGFFGKLLGLGSLGLILAAVAIIYLAFDELFTLFTGGRTIIEDLIDHFFGLGATHGMVLQLTAAWKGFQKALAEVGIELDDIDQMLGGAFIEYLKMIADQFRTAFAIATGLLNVLTDIVNKVAQIRKIGSSAIDNPLTALTNPAGLLRNTNTYAPIKGKGTSNNQVGTVQVNVTNQLPPDAKPSDYNQATGKAVKDVSLTDTLFSYALH